MTSTSTRTRSAYALVLLTLVYAFNIADRFVVSTLLEPIRIDLGLTDATVALITGVALALFYVSIGLPVAQLADRANRRNIVAASLALWSLMTALCGQAVTAVQFVLARFGVGIGEAGGTPPSTSILADLYPPSRRPAVLTFYALGAPLGAWMGSSLAGALAAHYGWRGTFIALGIPGIALGALVYLTIREPRRGASDHASSSSTTMGLADTLRHLRHNHAAFHLIGGGAVATLWGWGLLWWTPTYLVRAFHLSVSEAGAVLGPMHLIGGVTATVATYVAVVPLSRRDPRHVSWLMAGVVLLATIPSILIYTTSSLAVAQWMLWIVVPSIYFFIGPTMGLLQNVVPAGTRSQTIAVLLFVANVFNLIIAPQMVGIVSDLLAPSVGGSTESLRYALIGLAPTGFWGAWHYWVSARRLREAQLAASGA
jgi:predicted MFS family arabinose efflux permease